MRKLGAIVLLLDGLLLWPYIAQANCGTVDGPVATAAVKALDTKNVNLILLYVPGVAEAELIAAFEGALAVRTEGGDAKNKADREFVETAARLHREGEKTPSVGLKPAGVEVSPATAAAEEALESGRLRAVLNLLFDEVGHGIVRRHLAALANQANGKEPETKAGVQAARERMNAEQDFIRYVEGIYLATKDGRHAE